MPCHLWRSKIPSGKVYKTWPCGTQAPFCELPYFWSLRCAASLFLGSQAVFFRQSKCLGTSVSHQSHPGSQSEFLPDKEVFQSQCSGVLKLMSWCRSMTQGFQKMISKPSWLHRGSSRFRLLEPRDCYPILKPRKEFDELSLSLEKTYFLYSDSVLFDFRFTLSLGMKQKIHFCRLRKT